MRIELSKKYDLLVNTLIMACSSIGTTPDDTMEVYLEELEGDHYTFFDHINLVDFRSAGILNDLQIKNIISLKEMIGNIPANLWHTEALKADWCWTEVRQLSNEILNSMGFPKGSYKIHSGTILKKAAPSRKRLSQTKPTNLL